MSTVSTPRPATPPPDDVDPFCFGWRCVTVLQPDGTESYEEVPLTEEDILFPEEEDHILQTDLHLADITYLRGVFNTRLARVPRAVAVVDCRVDWSVPGLRPMGPDLAVFFGIDRRKNWATLNVAAEKARRGPVIEVTSPSTRRNDLHRKPELYHRAGVPLYIIADATESEPSRRRLRLFAYRNEPGGPRRVEPDPQGRIWIEAVGLWLGVVRDVEMDCDRLACFDGKTGEEVGDYQAITEELEAARAERAGLEERARAELEARTQAEARAETEARRAEAETRRAETEARRAEAETRRAETEARRAEAETRRARTEADARSLAEARARAEADARSLAEARARAEADARSLAEARIRELEEALRHLGQGS